jgi:ATP-dependent exoDNAse (exonuclease V) alpha subunit
VHKAQGQTLDCVEVDCYSFFAPGQMGVAVGRSVTKDGLRVVNFNLQDAKLKHPEEIYAFYA